MQKLLIQNGRIIDADTQKDEITNILIEDDTIKAIGNIEATPEMEVIDATGLVMMPGLIDIHVHLRGMDQADKETVETGTLAALKGGVTTIFAMPNTSPTLDSVESIQKYQALAKEAHVETHVIGSITKNLAGKELADIDKYTDLGIRAISDDGHDVDNEVLLTEAYQKARENNLLLITHPEMHQIAPDGVVNEGKVSEKLGVPGQPNEKEWKAVERGINIALERGIRAHFTHITTKESVELIREVKRRTRLISCDVTPHHLILTEERVLEVGSFGKVNPPLRTEADRQALIEGLKDGTIDLIATDHAPHREQDKTEDLLSSAFGFSQIETSLASMITELHFNQGIPLLKIVEWMCLNPARMMNLPQGRLKVGHPADVALVDLKAEKTVDRLSFVSKGKNSPYHDMNFKGWPVRTIFRGRIT